MLGAIAALTCGLTLIVVSWFDPFGREGERADGAARRATGVLLCVQIQTFQQRLDGITAIERQGRTLSESDANLKAVLVDGLDLYRITAGSLSTTCSPRSKPIPEGG